jgi:hypothetical protein
MATYRGTDGVIEIDWQGWAEGDRKMTEVQSFSASATATPINDNSSGDEWDTHLVGRSSLTGTVSVLYDYIMADIISLNPDYNTDQELISQLHFAFLGREILFTFYTNGTPEEQTVRLKGNGTITNIEVSNNHDNTPITLQISFQSIRAWTDTIVWNPAPDE